MFSVIRTEAVRRLGAIQDLLNELNTLQTGGQSTSRIVPQIKGLVFVQLYAVYEYTVVNAANESFRHIALSKLPLHSIRPSLHPVLLHSYLQSINAKSINSTWMEKIELFDRSREQTPFVASDLSFPRDNSHFRPPQLRVIWKLLGMSSNTVPHNRILGRIEEIVEHRNAIAHGRQSPEDIGSRFSIGDLSVRHKDIEQFCAYYLQELSSHCADPKNFC